MSICRSGMNDSRNERSAGQVVGGGGFHLLANARASLWILEQGDSRRGFSVRRTPDRVTRSLVLSMISFTLSPAADPRPTHDLSAECRPRPRPRPSAQIGRLADPYRLIDCRDSPPTLLPIGGTRTHAAPRSAFVATPTNWSNVSSQDAASLAMNSHASRRIG